MEIEEIKLNNECLFIKFKCGHWLKTNVSLHDLEYYHMTGLLKDSKTTKTSTIKDIINNGLYNFEKSELSESYENEWHIKQFIKTNGLYS